MTDNRDLQRECPECFAKPGEPCVVVGTGTKRWPHRRRGAAVTDNREPLALWKRAVTEEDERARQLEAFYRGAAVTDNRTYPHHGTCDRCAQGDRPLREHDPESEAWICEECDAELDRATVAAAEAMGTNTATAAAGIAAYFGAMEGQL